MPNRDSAYWIKKLKLAPHPEGGWFKEVYRSPEVVNREALPPRFSGSRNFSTAIYYLLEEGDFSAFHRIKSDEIWHFYDGLTMEIIEINATGKLTIHYLGTEPGKDTQPQVVVKAGSWFAARPLGSFTLVGCTVSPGFDFADFEMADKSQLTKQFPQYKNLTESLCKA